MKLKWLGTAGFEFKTEDQVFLFDPYLSRNQNADPKQEITPSDIKKASRIFISHGHFDHISDVPQIALQTNADIYCSSIAAQFLQHHKVDTQQIKPVLTDNKMFNFSGYTAQAFFSRHVKFDKKLVIATLLKINIRLFKYLPLFRQFPCGRVLSWRFNIEDKIVQCFGSAGSSSAELKKLGDKPIDILLLPLQGHSDICQIGLNYVKSLKPKIVIPHHYDNFFPPISKTIDIGPFVEMVKKEVKKTIVIIPKMNETFSL
ncbi:MAG: MBL fold metallo-hydrolase [Proteobacteria bacterium]|nr:MBL fold metallo-hydrolase [Pseudomonadota bacterium]MBU1583007.1 MBL fold metallo-hydrolase [Pseudomonadota bacterium]MBU2628405.1 MBL fold metallo-hydrolase [Pseudomonadota bacterium]